MRGTGFSLPVGVSTSGLSLILSLLAFFGVSWVTRRRAAGQLAADVEMVMDV